MFNQTNEADCNRTLNSNVTSTNHYRDSDLKLLFQILSYLPICIIFMGLTGNLTSLFIFRIEKDMKNMSSMVYLSFCCITDTLSLFTWNLNHFLRPNFNINVENLTIHTCRLFQFMQYSTLQSSALLLAIVCVDRYFTVVSTPGSWFSKLPFGTVKSSTIWSAAILIAIGLLNCFMLFTDRLIKYKNETTIDVNGTLGYESISNGFDCDILSNGYKIYPDYETVHILIYPTLAVIVMFIFNTLLITKTLSLVRKKAKTQNRKKAQNKMLNTTVSLLFISFMFVLMCLPGTFAYKYYGDFFDSTNLLKATILLLDSLSFLNRSSMFITCMISNIKFRRAVLIRIKWLCGPTQPKQNASQMDSSVTQIR